MRILASLAALLFLAGAAHAQVKQSGQVTPGHVTTWTTPGAIQDGGTPANPKITGGVGVFSTNAESICTQNALTGPITKLCLGTTPSGALISLDNQGGASGTLSYSINGNIVPFQIGPVNLPFLSATSFGVIADGTTPNDAAMASALSACSALGTALYLPPGSILLTGTQSLQLRNCAMVGSGIPVSGPLRGTTFLITSTTQTPFIIGNAWSLQGINFFYPNQTGAVVYPPLFTDQAGARQEQVYIDHVAIINAYDGFVQSSGSTWANWYVSNSSLYAVHDLFRVASTPDGWRIVNVHFTHGLWASVVGYPTVAAYLNAANANNTIWHVPTDSVVTVFMTGVTTFSWRYGIRVDSGGRFINSKIDGLWDGVATYMDLSDGTGGCADATVFTGAGGASYRPVFAADGSVTGTGTAPTFKFGATSVNCHGPYIQNLVMAGPVVGSFLESAGTNIVISGVQTLYGLGGGSLDYYGVLLSANTGSSSIQVNNSTFNASVNDAKHHGISVPNGASVANISNNLLIGGNEGITIALNSNTAMVQNNQILTTFGASSFIATGTGTLLYSGNILDKPNVASPVVSACGTGASVTGVLSGTIQVGSDNPTTSCVLTMAWQPYRNSSCVFTGRAAAAVNAVRATVGGLPQWTITTVGAVDMHDLQIQYNCAGNQ